MPLPTERTAAPELTAAVAYNNIPGFCTFQRILPIVRVKERSTYISFTKAVTKTELGITGTLSTDFDAAPTDTKVSTSNATVALKSLKQRRYVTFNEEQNFGNIDNVKIVGGSRVAKAELGNLECAVWAALAAAKSYTGTQNKLAKGSIRSALATAARDVSCTGKPVLWMAHSTFLRLTQTPEIADRLTVFAKAASDQGFLTVEPQKLAAALSSLLAIAEIVVSDDNLVPSSCANAIVVIGRQDEIMGRAVEAIDLAKGLPIAGALLCQAPVEAPVDDFPLATLYCFADNSQQRNVFDALASLGIFNANFDVGLQIFTLGESSEYADAAADAGA